MNERIERINQVIHTEATKAEIHDFLLSHVPFENVFIDEDGKSLIEENKSKSEDDLLESLTTSQFDDHRFILIKGNNGSGKSHLIRWLKEKYEARTDKNREAILLISRSHNTIREALTQIYESELFPKEMKEHEIEKIRNAANYEEGDVLKRTINFNFTLEIESDSKDANVSQKSQLNSLSRKYLRDFLLNDKVIEKILIKENGPLDRIGAKIEPNKENRLYNADMQIFQEEDFDISISWIKSNLESAGYRASDSVISFAKDLELNKNEFRRKVVAYLNSKTSAVIKKSIKLNADDFTNLFINLRKYLKSQGLGLTLFIEDINSFTGIDEVLMEVLLMDHATLSNEGLCRIKSIVGSTTAFYNEKLNQSIKDRITEQYYVTENSIFSTPYKLAQFAGKYINAINVSRNDSINWMKLGADDKMIPIFKDDHTWAQIDIQGQKYSIYPFNQNALWNLFQELEPGSKTPRVFIKDILRKLLTYFYDNPENFLSDENAFKVNGKKLSFYHYLDENTNKEMGSDSSIARGILLKIWGNRPKSSFFNVADDSVGGVPFQVFRDFNVRIVKDESLEAKENEKTEAIEPQKVKVDIVKVEQGSIPVHLLTDLRDWNSKETNLSSHNEIRNTLVDYFSKSINWEVYGISDFQSGRNFSSISHFNVEGSPVSNQTAFLLPRNEESYMLILSILSWKYIGKKSFDFDDGADILTIISSWLIKHEQEIIEYVEFKVKGNLNYLSIQLVIAKIIALQLRGKLKNLDSLKLMDIYQTISTTTPDGSVVVVSNYHSKEWSEIYTKMIDKIDEVDTQFKFHFSRSIGSSKAGSTDYTFIDTYEIVKCLEHLKLNNWDFRVFIEDLDRSSQKKDDVTIFLKEYLFKEKLIIDKEHEYFAEPMKILETLIGQDISANDISKTISEIKAFLRFTVFEIGHGYDTEQYNLINKTDIEKLLTREIELINKTLVSKSECTKLAEFSAINSQYLFRFVNLLKDFLGYLKQKESLFSGSVSGELIKSISRYKEKINTVIDQMEV